MPSVFFTSDLHLGHPRVAQLRGFDSVEEHDAAVAERWCSVVRPNDTVFVLGDVTGGSGRGRLIDALFALGAFPGTKHLVAGNHDAVHPMHRDAHKAAPDYALAFASVASAARRRIGGQEVLLSHFPYTRDRGETRYPQWRLPNLGAWLLHGHTHGPERVSLGHTHGIEREVHVGLDAWDLTPVHLDTLADLIKE